MPDRNAMTLAPHESLELHEIITSAIADIKKMEASLARVGDQEVASLIQDMSNAKKEQMRELKQFITSQGVLQ